MSKRATEDEIKQFLRNTMVEQWFADNKGLTDDIEELTSCILDFNTKWGTRFEPTEILKELNN